MKKTWQTGLFVFLLTACIQFSMQAMTATAQSPRESRHQLAEKMGQRLSEKYALSERAEKRLEKRLAKLEKRNKFKRLFGDQIDFQDDVEKWLWFGIFACGIALVISILAWSPLVGLLWVAGVVCLVVWIIKRYGGVA